MLCIANLVIRAQRAKLETFAFEVLKVPQLPLSGRCMKPAFVLRYSLDAWLLSLAI
jgi:hypothetical protein